MLGEVVDGAGESRVVGQGEDAVGGSGGGGVGRLDGVVPGGDRLGGVGVAGALSDVVVPRLLLRRRWVEGHAPAGVQDVGAATGAAVAAASPGEEDMHAAAAPRVARVAPGDSPVVPAEAASDADAAAANLATRSLLGPTETDSSGQEAVLIKQMVEMPVCSL